MFIDNQHSEFALGLYENKTFIIIDIILFSSVYIFLTYDWIAYSFLIHRYPYKIYRNGIIRTYIDLFQLFIKAIIVYMTTLKITWWHLFVIAIAFLMWHISVYIWHQCLIIEYKKDEMASLDHIYFATCYAVYGGVIYDFYNNTTTNSNISINSYTFILCFSIITISLIRQQRFINLASNKIDNDAAFQDKTEGE